MRRVTSSLLIFRALADPTRLRIVALLRQMELAVGELAQVLGQSQPRVSRHIKILADSGLADRRREGSWIFLTLGAVARDSGLIPMIDALADPSAERWAVADAARLAAVRADRVAAAEAFFDARAPEWDAIRSLHVAEAEVEGAMAALLADGDIGRLVDIGTGTGRMIELLGPRAATATGVDRSPEMLRLARAKCTEAGLATTDLRQGDMAALPLADASADTAVIHQVLHYSQAPELAIAEAARVLAPGGRLLIVDFAAHGHEELRERDAHARLGFSDAQIGDWCETAGLSLSASRELAGGHLSVKLWLADRRAAPPRLKVVA